MFDLLIIRDSISDFFNKGHVRTINAKKNIFYSFLIKGISVIVSFLMVPLTINYVSSEKYGIWLTLSSIIAWVGFFDIGLGNGLRNKFAEARAGGDNKLARIYISTTYAILASIIFVIWIIFIAVNPFIDWTRVLNTSPELREELKQVLYIVFSFFCLQFVFQLIGTILTADQKPARASFYSLLGNILSLIIIFILTKTTKGSLYKLALVLGGVPLFVLIIATLFYYNGYYRQFKPSFKCINLKYAGNLMSLGIKFFFLQVAALIIYQTNNIIIAQLFGPEEVTVYNIAFRYFYIISMVFGIIITPLWSAFTEANAKNDIQWIKNAMKRLVYVWMILCSISLIMLLFSNQFYRLWIGPEIRIPIILSLVMAASVIINTWCSIYSYYLNGVGKIRLQLYSGAIGAVLNIPLAVFLGKRFGISGVVGAGIILGLISSIWAPVQSYKLIRKTASGIWNK